MELPQKYFTVEEANRMIPELEESFGRIVQLRAYLKGLYKRLEERRFAPTEEHFPIAVPGAPPDVIRDRASFKGLVETLREEITQVQALGAMVKDLETGLVDWLAKKDGRDIFLCWRYGEKEVAWWHEVEGGFAGRRPVSELVAPRPSGEHPPKILH